VEIVIGSHKNNTAKIGTYTADDITIVTDNTERMLFSRSGEIVVGHPKHKNGVFKVNGKIIADSIETENRSIKSLEFGPPEWHTEPYQIGLFWKGTSTRSLTLDLNPDRLLSTESIDLAVEKKKPEAERLLPLFVFKNDKEKFYIPSVRGSGLWDEIWGNIAVKSDLNTIAGVTFDHKGETPGLGAEIKDNPGFPGQFVGKQMFKDGEVAILVKKGGSQDKLYEVDGISIFKRLVGPLYVC
jgi:hypothetical protein